MSPQTCLQAGAVEEEFVEVDKVGEVVAEALEEGDFQEMCMEEKKWGSFLIFTKEKVLSGLQIML